MAGLFAGLLTHSTRPSAMPSICFSKHGVVARQIRPLIKKEIQTHTARDHFLVGQNRVQKCGPFLFLAKSSVRTCVHACVRCFCIGHLCVAAPRVTVVRSEGISEISSGYAYAEPRKRTCYVPVSCSISQLRARVLVQDAGAPGLTCRVHRFPRQEDRDLQNLNFLHRLMLPLAGCAAAIRTWVQRSVPVVFPFESCLNLFSCCLLFRRQARATRGSAPLAEQVGKGASRTPVRPRIRESSESPLNSPSLFPPDGDPFGAPSVPWRKGCGNSIGRNFNRDSVRLMFTRLDSFGPRQPARMGAWLTSCFWCAGPRTSLPSVVLTLPLPRPSPDKRPPAATQVSRMASPRLSRSASQPVGRCSCGRLMRRDETRFRYGGLGNVSSFPLRLPHM